MQAIQISNNKTERIELFKPFKGFTIGLVTEHDTAATAITDAMKIDPMLVILTLRNRRADRNVFQMPLGQIHRFLKNGDKDLYDTYVNKNHIDLTPGGAGDEIVLQDFSLPMHTYHGDYELLVEVRNAMQVNTKTNSYVTVLPIWSDDAMLNEVIYNDLSLDKAKVDKYLGNGIEQMIIMNTSQTGSTSFGAVTKAAYTSIEQSQDMNNAILVAHTQSFEETPHATNRMGQLTLHDDEVLSDVNVSIEMGTPSASWVLMYAKLYENPNADASLALSENRRNQALDLVSA